MFTKITPRERHYIPLKKPKIGLSFEILAKKRPPVATNFLPRYGDCITRIATETAFLFNVKLNGRHDCITNFTSVFEPTKVPFGSINLCIYIVDALYVCKVMKRLGYNSSGFVKFRMKLSVYFMLY